jgi:hypothetical protein
LALLGLLGLLGCGPGGLAFQAANFTGTWAGTWASDNGTSGGQLTLELLQVGPIVQGNATFTNSPCITSGTVGGSANGGSFTGTIDFGGNPITVQLNVTGTSMSGRYADNSGGPCSGDQGDYDLDRQ